MAKITLSTKLLSLSCLIAFSACGGGGGGGQTSPDLSGTWKGTLNFLPDGDTTPNCSFHPYDASMFREVGVEPDPNAHFFEDQEPSQILASGLSDNETAPEVGDAGYEGDLNDPIVSVDFPSFDRTASEDVRAKTPCKELQESLFDSFVEWRPVENSLIIDRTFVETCTLPSGQNVSCNFQYEGFFNRR